MRRWLLAGLFALGCVAAAPAAGASGPQTLFGTSVASKADLAKKTNQFGHMPVVRVFYTKAPPADAWSTELGANHSAVVVSFTMTPQSVLSGADDSALVHFFNTAPTGLPIYYSYFHEPEPFVRSHQFTTTEYRAAWEKVMALAATAHNPDLHSTLILMAWDVNPHSGVPWHDYLAPGIAVMGWDNYPNGGVGLKSPSLFMGPAVAAARSVGLPFGFAEFGTSTVSGRPAWLQAVGMYLESQGALFGTIFDSPNKQGLGGAGSFVLRDAASIQAWRAVTQG